MIADIHFVDFLATSLHGATSQAVPRAVAPGDPDRWPRAATEETAGQVFEAAYGNAVAAHRLDWDDVMVGVPTHPGTVIFAALMAVAGVRELTVGRVTEAFQDAVDLCARLGEALGQRHYNLGWHATTTIGRMAAAHAVAAVLHPEEPDAPMRALHMAAVDTGGVSDVFGTSMKPLQVGAAAGGAAVCGLLSVEVDDVPEVLRPGTKLATILGLQSELATEVRGAAGVDLLRVKRYPCCYYAHPATLAADRLELTGRDERLEVRISAAASRVCHTEQPDTIDDARFSLPWLVAGAMVADDGALGLLDRGILSSPDQAEMASRVHVRVDTELPPFAAVASSANGHAELDLGTTPASDESQRVVEGKVALLDATGSGVLGAALADPAEGAAVPVTDLIEQLQRADPKSP